MSRLVLVGRNWGQFKYHRHKIGHSPGNGRWEGKPTVLESGYREPSHYFFRKEGRGSSRGKRESQTQKTMDDPLFHPLIDIAIPFSYSPDLLHGQKFLPANVTPKFLTVCHLPKISPGKCRPKNFLHLELGQKFFIVIDLKVDKRFRLREEI